MKERMPSRKGENQRFTGGETVGPCFLVFEADFWRVEFMR